MLVAIRRRLHAVLGALEWDPLVPNLTESEKRQGFPALHKFLDESIVRGI